MNKEKVHQKQNKQQSSPKTKGKSNEEKNEKYIAKKVGQYLLIKEIGKGTSAVVFKGVTERTFKKVAVKQIQIKKLNKKQLDRVQQEFEILQKIKHKNIVQVLDMKKSENHTYLVFEYCQHGNLDNYIENYFENKKMSEKKVQQVVQQLVEGLKVMQTHKIVHRDLKLANILVGEDFTIKIADFGFAKFSQDDALFSTTLGTPITMCPEILDGKQYNEKCDIWSLGVIIYQMISGKPPFMPNHGTGIKGLRFKIEEGVIDFTGINISEILKELIQSMLVKDPQQRMGFKQFFQNDWVNGSYKIVDEEDLNLEASLKKAKEETIDKHKRNIENQKLMMVKEAENKIMQKININLGNREQQNKEQKRQNNVNNHNNKNDENEDELDKYIKQKNSENMIHYNRKQGNKDKIDSQKQCDNKQNKEIMCMHINNYSEFQGQFLANGQKDISNIALILYKKLTDLLNNIKNQNLNCHQNKPIEAYLLELLVQYTEEKVNDLYKQFEEKFCPLIKNQEQQTDKTDKKNLVENQENQNLFQADNQVINQIREFQENVEQQIQQLQQISNVYQDIVLPKNDIFFQINSKLIQQDEIEIWFSSLVSKNNYIRYSYMLKNLKYYEQYLQYEDYFDFKILEKNNINNQECLEKLKAIYNQYIEHLELLC